MQNTNTTSMVSATTTTDNANATEKKSRRMNVRIVPTGVIFGSGNGDEGYEKLDLRIGSIVAGFILKSKVRCGGHDVKGASLPEKIQNATGCTYEEAVEALTVYGESAED
ncbi:MAG: hypothetical protein WCO97_06995 [bacterium]